MEAQKEILDLTRELEHAGFLYYVKDAPEMSDYDYDRKLFAAPFYKRSQRKPW